MRYILNYQTGEEFLTLKDELLNARERILAEHPDLKQEVAARKAYSKYSRVDVNVEVLSPSLVRYVAVGSRKARLTNVIPKNADEQGWYIEYFFAADGEFLGCREFRLNKLRYELFAVDFDGYKYVLNLDEYDDYKNKYDFICRKKYDGQKLIEFDEYTYGESCGSSYYSEIYYQLDGKNLCTALFTDNEYDVSPDFEKGLLELFPNDLAETRNKWRNDYYEGLKLPVSARSSTIHTCVYELTFDEKNKLERIDKINPYSGEITTIFPRKKKTPSHLPATRDGIKTLRKKLNDNGYAPNKGIKFSAFWEAFKDFCLNDKYDCADDDILFEPMLTDNAVSIHVARQFCHEDAYGQYEKMEQLNIDFDVEIISPASGEPIGTVWSEKDFVKFFNKVERSKEFKSVPPEKSVKLYMNFGEV